MPIDVGIFIYAYVGGCSCACMRTPFGRPNYHQSAEAVCLTSGMTTLIMRDPSVCRIIRCMFIRETIGDFIF